MEKYLKSMLYKWLFLVVMFCFVSEAHSQSIFVDDVHIEPGGTAEVFIKIDNATAYNAAGMNVTLPESGFTFVYNEEEENYCLGGTVFAKSHTVETNLQKTNQLRFAVVSMKNAAFKTYEGTLVGFVISVDGNVREGEYEGKVWGTNKFSWIDKTAAQEVEDVTFKITVGKGAPSFGDLVASVSQDKNIPTNGLSALSLSYSEIQGYSLSLASTTSKVKLTDSNGSLVEEVSVQNNNGKGAVNFTSKLKRGEKYNVSVPVGLYKLTDDNSGSAWDSPESQLTYTTDYILGDVDDDQKHTITDVVGVASYILKGSAYVGQLVVDCNTDDDVNTTDITSLVHKVLTGSFPASGANARERAMAMSSVHPQLNMTNTDNLLAISLNNSGNYNAMQFDVALTDDFGNDMTSADDIMIQANNGIHGHNISSGIVDGKLRVLIYSLANRPFDSDDIVTLNVKTDNNCTATITNAKLSTTDFATMQSDDVETRLGVVTGIREVRTSESKADIYDLNGRKLNAEPKRGVVIINNKKVLR